MSLTLQIFYSLNRGKDRSRKLERNIIGSAFSCKCFLYSCTNVHGWIICLHSFVENFIRDPPWGVLNPNFPWKNRLYLEIPWNIFDFPNAGLSFLSSRGIFCFRLGDLFKRVTIKQLPRKNVQVHYMGLPGKFWTPISREKTVFMFIRSRQNYLSRYNAIISYFSRLPDRKLKNSWYHWCISYRVPQF